MAKDKPAFAPVPFLAIHDATLTALDWRVLACIAWHDRLSIWRGGKGCYASHRTMADEVGCNETSFSKVASKLVSQSYVSRERNPIPGRGRHYVYRVFYEEAPQSRWARAPSQGSPRPVEMVGPADQELETVSQAAQENDTFPPIAVRKRFLEERKETSIEIESINYEESAASLEERDPSLIALERALTSLSAKMREGEVTDRVYWADRLAEIEDPRATAWAKLLRDQLIKGMTEDERDRVLHSREPQGDRVA